MDKYNHKCLTCGEAYTDTDPDPYYCEPCNDKRKAIAKEIDKKVAATPKRKQMSALQEYDASQKGPGGFVQVKL